MRVPGHQDESLARRLWFAWIAPMSIPLAFVAIITIAIYLSEH